LPLQLPQSDQLLEVLLLDGCTVPDISATSLSLVEADERAVVVAAAVSLSFAVSSVEIVEVDVPLTPWSGMQSSEDHVTTMVSH